MITTTIFDTNNIIPQKLLKRGHSIAQGV